MHASLTLPEALRTVSRETATVRPPGDFHNTRDRIMSGTHGELMPQGGGDPIPLLKTSLLVGRRESCDIVLRFPNVSSRHCELNLIDGYWFVKDLGSSNGTKVNGTRISEQRVDPGDTLAIAKHAFEVCYEPSRLGAAGAPPTRSASEGILSRSLLEAAGLESRRESESHGRGKPARPEPIEWHTDGDSADDASGR
jgi:adenylate cyclase